MIRTFQNCTLSKFRGMSLFIKRNGSSSTAGGDKRHPPEYLEVAKNWPHEEYSPENYTTLLPRHNHEVKKDIQVAASTHDHHHHHHGEEPAPITFNTPAWHKTLGVVAISLLAWRISQEYSSDESKPHPISQLLESLQSFNTAQQAHQTDKESIPARLQQARDNLIFNSKRKSPSRWTIPLDRASDFLIPVGSQVEGLGEGRIYTWQEYDDVDRKSE